MAKANYGQSNFGQSNFLAHIFGVMVGPQRVGGTRRVGPRRVGPRRVEPRRVEPRRVRGPKISLFFPSSATIFILLSLSWGSFVDKNSTSKNWPKSKLAEVEIGRSRTNGVCPVSSFSLPRFFFCFVCLLFFTLFCSYSSLSLFCFCSVSVFVPKNLN